MHRLFPPEMTEALRLTLASHPGEATAAIQRALGGVAPETVQPREQPSTDEAVDATYRVVRIDSTRTEAPTVAPAPQLLPVVAYAGAPHVAAINQLPASVRIDRGPREGTAAKLAEALSVIEQTLAAALPTRAGLSVSLPGAALMPATNRVDVQPAGQFVTGSYTGPAGTRQYKLYVPTGYVGQNLPLVVMLHGCTQNASDIAAGTRLNQLAEQDPHLIVYPEQTASANPQRCWNWFQAAHQVRDEGEPSLIAGITREVMAAYRVDRDRVHVAGMSAGGAMATIVGASYPDLYAAIGVHSGLARRAAHDLPSALAAMQKGGPDAVHGDVDVQARVPLIVFHGDRDRTVHPRNGQRVVAHALRASSEDSEHVLRASVDHGQVPGGHAYTRTVYQDATAQIVAEHWLVQGAGHAWSGGSPAGSFTDPQGPDASAEMLRFFREHPKTVTGT